jgi:hypothetical protein
MLRQFNYRFLFLLELSWVEVLVFLYMEDFEFPLITRYILETKLKWNFFDVIALYLFIQDEL